MFCLTGNGEVLRNPSALRYDAEWSVLSACALGAPHTRERVFIVAYTHEVSPWWGSAKEPSAPRRALHAPSGHRITLRLTDLVKLRDGGLINPSGSRADGVSRRLDRVGYLGNAVVPQAAELVGRYIRMIDEAIQ